jgi:hypothetical protein
MGKWEWWERSIPKVREIEPELLQYGSWIGPTHYRFRHPTSGRTQDIVFPAGRDPVDMARIAADQERKALVELAEPGMHKPQKSKPQSMDRRLTEIAGRRQAITERWW